MNNEQSPSAPATRRPRRSAHRRAAAPSAATVSAAASRTAERAAQRRSTTRSAPAPLPVIAMPSLPSVEEAPVAAINIAASGIHPSTSRLIAISVVFYAQDRVTEVGSFTRRFNPGKKFGPVHMHGYHAANLDSDAPFGSSVAAVRDALEDRTVIMHDIPLVWGFITEEYRRAQHAANRARALERSSYGREGRGRSTRVTINPPKPTELIDTLATSRRQQMPAVDTRLRAVAALYPVTKPPQILPELGAVASQKRRRMDPDALLIADARMVAALHNAQRERAAAIDDETQNLIATVAPTDLTADQFSLQRSHLRVDATKAPRPLANPGTPRKRKASRWKLVAGMEFVVSPDIAMDPDKIIAAGTAAGLVYNEKLSRETSLVVCNATHELRGKALHADRKDIPLISDQDFLDSLDNVAEGTPASEERDPRRVRSASAAGTRHSRRGSRGAARRGSRGSRARRGSRGGRSTRGSRGGRGRRNRGGHGTRSSSGQTTNVDRRES